MLSKGGNGPLERCLEDMSGKEKNNKRNNKKHSKVKEHDKLDRQTNNNPKQLKNKDKKRRREYDTYQEMPDEKKTLYSLLRFCLKEETNNNLNN